MYIACKRFRRYVISFMASRPSPVRRFGSTEQLASGASLAVTSGFARVETLHGQTGTSSLKHVICSLNGQLNTKLTGISGPAGPEALQGHLGASRLNTSSASLNGW